MKTAVRTSTASSADEREQTKHVGERTRRQGEQEERQARRGLHEGDYQGRRRQRGH